MMEVEKQKAFDLMFIEFGVTEDEITRAVREHELLKSVEYTALQQELQAKFMASQP